MADLSKHFIRVRSLFRGLDLSSAISEIHPEEITTLILYFHKTQQMTHEDMFWQDEIMMRYRIVSSSSLSGK